MTERLNVADLNAIETRVAAWVADCQPLLKVFEPRPGKPNGNDPYIDFGGKLFRHDIRETGSRPEVQDKMVRKAANHRQMGKVRVLGCVYRMGGGGWGTDPKTGDDIKTGLVGFAEGYGVQMGFEQGHQVVSIFREVYSEIKQCWFDIEKAYTDVLEGTRVKRADWARRLCSSLINQLKPAENKVYPADSVAVRSILTLFRCKHSGSKETGKRRRDGCCQATTKRHGLAGRHTLGIRHYEPWRKGIREYSSGNCSGRAGRKVVTFRKDRHQVSRTCPRRRNWQDACLPFPARLSGNGSRDEPARHMGSRPITRGRRLRWTVLSQIV